MGIEDSNKTDVYDNALVTLADGPQLDSYGRHRVANPQIQFAIYFSNTAHSLLVNSATTGSGTLTFNSTIGSGRLTCTTGATDSVIVQSKRYMRYNPGVSYLLGFSGIIGAPKANTRQRWGYFDDQDGLFFEQLSTGIGIVTRTSTSGSPVDTRVTQSNWNIDKMDGSGNPATNPSGINLDTSKQNLYMVDFVWQGAGAIRFGIMTSTGIQYVHRINNANIFTAPYLRSPSKPGRVELTNLAGTASTTTLDVVCMTAIRESITDTFAPYTFSASTKATKTSLTSTTVFTPILSIRPKATFNGITNRVPVQPTHCEVLSVQDSCAIAVILNGTLTGASFTSVDANSATEYDDVATAISGGTVVEYFFVPGGGKGLNNTDSLGDEIVLGLNIAGSTADVITIAGIKLNANTDTYANIVFQEFQ